VGVNGVSIADPSDCPGDVGLKDLTNLKAAIQPGGTSVLKFMATTCDTGWQRLAYAYIDFDGDGVYESPQEMLGSQSVDNRVEPFEVSFTFSPPCEGAGAVVGVTRMRIFVVESGFTPNPCLSFSYGGVKEFSIEIIPTPGAKCGGRDIGNGLSGGWIFIILLLVFTFVYFTFSAVWILKLHPEHRDKIWFAPLTPDFWRKGFHLVKDGCVYSKLKSQELYAKARGRAAPGYDTL
jgi:hypothetical protein